MIDLWVLKGNPDSTSPRVSRECKTKTAHGGINPQVHVLRTTYVHTYSGAKCMLCISMDMDIDMVWRAG